MSGGPESSHKLMPRHVASSNTLDCKCKSKYMVDTLKSTASVTSPLDQSISEAASLRPSSRAEYCRLARDTSFEPRSCGESSRFLASKRLRGIGC